MRRTPLLLLVLAAIIGIAATTHDVFLLPESFFLHKGDKLDLHLVMGDVFVKQEEMKNDPAKTTKFMMYSGSKKIDLAKAGKEGAAPIVSVPVELTGQCLVEMNRGVEYSDASRDSYSDFLTAQGQDKLAESVRNSNHFRIKEKYTRYLKTLLSVDDHDGGIYEKVLNEEYELVLKENPYKKKYGDDMTAQLFFKGKPLNGATVSLYIKSIGGNVYTQNFATDKKGMVYFTMSREGIFMLRSIHVEATKDKDADYASWWAAYTFAFSSSDEVPNTYREFGFGDKH